jgi:hypothetical protein
MLAKNVFLNYVDAQRKLSEPNNTLNSTKSKRKNSAVRTSRDDSKTARNLEDFVAARSTRDYQRSPGKIFQVAQGS